MQARSVFDSGELTELGDRMAAMKEQLTGQPVR
jgi:hypothetical protein